MAGVVPRLNVISNNQREFAPVASSSAAPKLQQIADIISNTDENDIEALDKEDTTFREDRTNDQIQQLDSIGKKGWSLLIEVYVSSISQKSKVYRNIHEACAIHFENRFNYFSILLIVLSFITTAVSLLPFFSGEIFKYIVVISSLLLTTLVTVNKFLRYQELSTKHRLASQKFLELHRNITEQFLIPPEARTNGIIYVSQIGKTFDQIVKSLPYPPRKVVQKLKMSSSPDSDINLPSFLQAQTTANVNEVAGILPVAENHDVILNMNDSPIERVNPLNNDIETIKLTALQKLNLERARRDLSNFSADFD